MFRRSNVPAEEYPWYEKTQSDFERQAETD